MSDGPLSKCPDCKYDLTGLPPTGACPECGFAFDKTMRIWWGPRPHRAWGIGAMFFLALVMTLGACEPVRENLLELIKTHTAVAIVLFVSIPVLLALVVRDATRWRYIAVSALGITVRGRSGRRRWAWNELERVDVTALNIELHSKNENRPVRLVLPASPVDRDELVENVLALSRASGVDGSLREADRQRGTNAYAWNTARRIGEYLDERNIAYALVGGLALEYYGGTRVVDLVELLVQSAGARQRALTVLAMADSDLRFESDCCILDRSTGKFCRIWIVGEEISGGVAWEQFAADAHRSTNGLTFAHHRAILEATLVSCLIGEPSAREDALAIITKLRLPESFADSIRPELRTMYASIGRPAWVAGDP